MDRDLTLTFLRCVRVAASAVAAQLSADLESLDVSSTIVKAQVAASGKRPPVREAPLAAKWRSLIEDPPEPKPEPAQRTINFPGSVPPVGKSAPSLTGLKDGPPVVRGEIRRDLIDGRRRACRISPRFENEHVVEYLYRSDGYSRVAWDLSLGDVKRGKTKRGQIRMYCWLTNEERVEVARAHGKRYKRRRKGGTV